MIVRVFRVTARPGRRAAFEAFFRETAIPLMRRQPGLETLIPCVPRPDAPDTFCLVMVWRDLAALRAFAGEDWERPHIAPEEADLVAERQLEHYELA